MATSLVIVAPYMLAVATEDLASIESVINAANTATVTATTGMLAPATDEVSAITASLFAEYTLMHQAVSVQAATCRDQFVRALATSGGARYAAAKAANALPFQEVLNLVNVPT
ncbi:PE family protein [Mycobacterium leprae]|uniref:PE family protein n=1 Tax=Mycobacterium leprae TaxID=1769 RepID=A0AAD0P8Q0_MYCLR|nr:PE family protein [Mycobacterium leprae]AWV47993.1 PE family protein [Mycobacterium leprae]OAR19810.1 hypothetical protein A8144_03965 [Mycobacterium leprae 3125609]OAX71924.1 hypothetical protein A3216_03000 [Mycobacterium leprae 7935681]